MTGPVKPLVRPVRSRDGWRGLRCVRPANGAVRAPAADDAPFHEDTLEDVGR